MSDPDYEPPEGTGGIVFFGTRDRDAVVDWYRSVVGADVWLEQPDCTILESNGFRFGFCERDEAETGGILTFVYDSRAAVDEMTERAGDAVEDEPRENDVYDIYQCFAADPEGRTVEFQVFL